MVRCYIHMLNRTMLLQIDCLSVVRLSLQTRPLHVRPSHQLLEIKSIYLPSLRELKVDDASLSTSALINELKQRMEESYMALTNSIDSETLEVGH